MLVTYLIHCFGGSFLVTLPFFSFQLELGHRLDQVEGFHILLYLQRMLFSSCLLLLDIDPLDLRIAPRLNGSFGQLLLGREGLLLLLSLDLTSFLSVLLQIWQGLLDVHEVLSGLVGDSGEPSLEVLILVSPRR